MSKRSRDKRATPRGAYEPAENESLEHAFVLASSALPKEPAEPPAYPFGDEEGEE